MSVSHYSHNPNKRLLDYIYSRQPEMIALLEQFVQAESPSNVPESQQGMMNLLAESFQKRGYRVSRFPGRQTGGQLLAKPDRQVSRQPLQLILGHSDTVWPLGTLKKMPLYQKADKMYGPGIYDMKAGLIQMLFALEAIQAMEIPTKVSPVIFINSDEEIGSIESQKRICRLAAKMNRVLVLEPSLGIKGKLKTRRKGVARFTVKVLGKASHAGLAPEKGASAILELSYTIQKLFALNDPEKGITVNVGTIDGGIRPNVVAPASSAVVDVRVLHTEDMSAIEQKIKNVQPTLPNTRLEIEGHFEHPPMEKTPRNQQLWYLARQVASEIGLDLEEGTAGGSSDGNTTSIYAPTLDGLGAVGDGAHAPDEFIYWQQMTERSALLARLLIADVL
ncbi:MAG: M20 family metallopeptidase [Spirulina sp.]